MKNRKAGFTQAPLGDLSSSPLVGEVARSADGGLSNRGTLFNTLLPRLTAVLPQSGKTCLTTLLPGYAVLPPQGGKIKRHNSNLASQGREITARGFTLIELLVVILIIGILAAVAVPQYKVAVAKSRVSTMVSLGKAIADAQEVYYLSNGTYAKDVKKLDIDISKECPLKSVPSTSSSQTFACGNDFFFDNKIGFSDDKIAISYCPNASQSWSTCQPKEDLRINFYLQHDASVQAGKRTCTASHNSTLGKAICASFGDFENN